MKRVAFFLYSLSGGGTERVNLSLMDELLRMGYLLDLILVQNRGELVREVPAGVRVLDLKNQRAAACVFHLAAYLRAEQHAVLFTAFPTLNLVGIAASLFAHRGTVVVPTEHMPVSTDARENPDIEPRLAYRLYPLFYRYASAVVVNNHEAAQDFRDTYPSVSEDKLHVIYNPVVSQRLLDMIAEPTELACFLEEPRRPIVLGVGRLSRQKNFPLLVEAFALVRAQLDCCLVILGEGDRRAEIVERVAALKLQKDVILPGFVKNPYPYMAGSDVFVLSSIYETLPTVLIEALACGAPVVATKCFGVAEILCNGEYGAILQRPSAEALADAILRKLSNKPDRNSLRQRGCEFSVAAAATKYAELIERLTLSR